MKYPKYHRDSDEKQTAKSKKCAARALSCLALSMKMALKEGAVVFYSENLFDLFDFAVNRNCGSSIALCGGIFHS
jgi:phage pi2 protein 07